MQDLTPKTSAQFQSRDQDPELRGESLACHLFLSDFNSLIQLYVPVGQSPVFK